MTNKFLALILRTFLLLSVLVYNCACSNEFVLDAAGGSVPIVYCLLNPLEQDQYVRVGKSFGQAMKQVGAELEADSLFWPNDVQVYLERWENNSLAETINFDLTQISKRDSGLFPIEGLRIYHAEFQPESGQEYHLFVYFPELNKIVSGQCQILSVPEVIDPEFVPGRTVSFDTISSYNIRWKGGTHSGIYQGVFKMNYSESVEDNFVNKFCYFVTPLYQRQFAGDIYEEQIRGVNFLISVGQQIEPIPGVIRKLINFEFIFYAGGSDLALLIDNDLGDANPFAIIRNTSNISGGIGVFSSITTQRFPNLEPSVITKYFLATSQFTKDLGFKTH